MPDHVHMLVAIPSKYCINIHGILEGEKCANDLREHTQLKYKYGDRKLLTEGYYVSTMGLNEATVAKYIREQEAHDQAIDKLSVKEYEDTLNVKKGNSI